MVMTNTLYALPEDERLRRAKNPSLSFIESMDLQTLRQYAHILSIDERTGLLARDAFVHAISAFDARIFPLPMLVYDVVGLKELNNHAHWLGDAALAVAGTLIHATTTEAYLCSRLGGDEFGVLPPVTAGAAGTAFLLEAQQRFEVAAQQATDTLSAMHDMRNFRLKVRYGIVPIRDATPDAVYCAIDQATRRAYKEIPATQREKELYV